MTKNQDSYEELKNLCAKLLVAIPGADEMAVNVADFVDDFLIEYEDAESLRSSFITACETVVTMFESLGLLEHPHTATVQASSDLAATFLHSLGQYLASELKLLGDWQARGESPDAKRIRGLIGLLEEYRVSKQGERAPAARCVEAVAAIIKGKIAGEEVYLLQYNPPWQIPWWIGGIIEKGDSTPEAALRREIEEEQGITGRDIMYMQPFAEITDHRMSARVRAVTDYHYHFFDVVFKEKDVPEEIFRSRSEITIVDRHGREIS